MRNFVFLLLILFFSACSSTTKEQIGKLENTIWIHQPFEDDNMCIDSLIFYPDFKGVFYRCEHDFHDSITYRIENNTLYINRYNYISDVDANQQLEVESKYVLIMREGRLKMTDIKHRYNDSFNSIDPKFVEGNFFSKVK